VLKNTKKGLKEMDKEKLKVLFVSDLVVETGFATVAHNIIKHNLSRFDFTGVGVNYNGDPHEYSFPIYPAMSRVGGNMYGVDRVVNILNSEDFDLVYILNDAWVISYYLEAIKKNVSKRLPKIVVYIPVDARFHDTDWYRDFDIVTETYAYTDFGKKVINQCKPELNVGVMFHGVASDDFYKLYDDRYRAKTDLFGDKLQGVKDPEDSFIVLNANRNQPRKKLDITIAGFSMFADDKPNNVKIYMHCGVVDSHINIIKEAKRYGVEDRLVFTSFAQGIQRTPKARLNQIYNSCDVGINTSLGEGWGLTNMEHAVTGAAQIVPRHSACQELFFDCGLMMETITNITFDQVETVGRLTTPDEVARNLELIYKNTELRQFLSEKAREKFLRPEYQWKTIANQWGDIFERVCS
jgi:D-inositol-3-phosphate glycosyltransferase